MQGIARRIAAMVATLLAVPALGACGTSAEARRTEVAAVARTAPAVRNLPSAFPFPPGSRVADLADRRAGASFTLAAPDPQAVLSFYRHHLPLSAFTIVADRSEPDASSLAFRNEEGWAGSIFATAHRVTVAVRRA
ncbi:hypothetical protein AB0F81_10000 [Actinoplanes sp. NPDC024001]|uniref:hypothetical protein n=1 Tax=Actinoplanes sp. NPDC024001 TaxID=3154598 RepID=UPI0033CCDE7F